MSKPRLWKWIGRALLAIAPGMPVAFAPAHAATVLNPGTTFGETITIPGAVCQTPDCQEGGFSLERTFAVTQPPAGSDPLNIVVNLSLTYSIEAFAPQRYTAALGAAVRTPVRSGPAIVFVTQQCTESFVFGCLRAERRHDASIPLPNFSETSLELFMDGFLRGPTTGQLSYTVFVSGSPLPEVPLPAAAWLLLGGVGMLGAAARRRTAAVA